MCRDFDTDDEISTLWIESMPVGAPEGNQNAAKAKRWEAAIIRAFEAWPEKPDSTDCNALMRGLNEAAYTFVFNVIAGKDIGYFRETGDRLDGKVSQPLEHSGDLVVKVDQTDAGL